MAAAIRSVPTLFLHPHCLYARLHNDDDVNRFNKPGKCEVGARDPRSALYGATDETAFTYAFERLYAPQPRFQGAIVNGEKEEWEQHVEALRRVRAACARPPEVQFGDIAAESDDQVSFSLTLCKIALLTANRHGGDRRERQFYCPPYSQDSHSCRTSGKGAQISVRSQVHLCLFPRFYNMLN